MEVVASVSVNELGVPKVEVKVNTDTKGSECCGKCGEQSAKVVEKNSVGTGPQLLNEGS